MKKKIIGLSGLAGSGKDFIANLLVKNHGFVKIALADPLKRICQDVFDFSDEQLFGSSEERNKPDKRYFTGKIRGDIIGYEDTRILLCLEKGIEPTHEEIEEGCKIYLTPRFALQSLGTEWGRRCYPNIWTDYTLKIARKLLSDQNWQYDPRYGIWQDENIREVRGVVISDIRFRNEMEAVKAEDGKVIRIVRNKPTTLSGAASLHSSEQEQKEISDTEFDYILNNQEDLIMLQTELKSMLEQLSV